MDHVSQFPVQLSDLTFKRCKDPVELPCGHIVEREIANDILATATKRDEVAQCPLDRTPFSTHTITTKHSPQKPYPGVQGEMNKLMHEIQESVKIILPCIQEPQGKQGKKALFKCTSPWHTMSNSSFPTDCRYIGLESVDPHSLLKRVHVTGKIDGTFRIKIDGNEEQKELFNTLVSQMGFTVFEGFFCIYAQTDSEINLACKFLLQHIEFQQPELLFLQRLAQLKSWPQAEEELHQFAQLFCAFLAEQKFSYTEEPL